MPHKFFILLLSWTLGATLYADTPPRERPALWFDVGEELHYRIYWGVIYVGDTRVTTEWIEENGRDLIAIRYRTRSNAFLDRIYRVDDTIEAVIEPHSFLPIRFSKVLNEGRYRTDELTVFDHAARKAYWTHRQRGERTEFSIDPDTRDLVTFMYYMRQRAFQPGETAQFRVMADEKIYDLTVTAGPVESMKMPRYGRVKTLRITPEASFQGLFVRKGRMTLWISQDARRIATRIQATVPVADVHINLHEVRGPGDDMWVRGAAAPGSAAEARFAAGEGPYVH
jgi:hypothetical protein